VHSPPLEGLIPGDPVDPPPPLPHPGSLGAEPPLSPPNLRLLLNVRPQGCAVKFSPFQERLLAVSTAQNFGIVGNGRLHILEATPQGSRGAWLPPPRAVPPGATRASPRSPLAQLAPRPTRPSPNSPHPGHHAPDSRLSLPHGESPARDPAASPPQAAQGMQEIAAFDTLDGLYDCAWSEANEHVVVSASGDGSVRAYDLTAPPPANPVRLFAEHTHEVHSVNWSPLRRDCFVTTSWDDSVKVWAMEAPHSIRTFQEHSYCVYSSAWCPTDPEVFVTASGDCTCKIFDMRKPTSSMTLRPHDFEVLCVDWNKYDDHVIATGSVDKSVRLWDLRQPRLPLGILPPHEYAVRKVLFSPFQPGLLASCSYDMTVALWDTTRPAAGPLQRWGHHTEFAVGLDWSSLAEGVLASTGWDGMTYVWDAVGGNPGQTPRRWAM